MKKKKNATIFHERICDFILSSYTIDIIFCFSPMKKLLVITTLLLLGSCSLFDKAPTSFEDYYTRNVRATIESTEKTLESLGLFRSTETSGVFDALVSVPILLSGSLMTDYNVQSDGRNAAITATE